MMPPLFGHCPHDHHKHAVMNPSELASDSCPATLVTGLFTLWASEDTFTLMNQNGRATMKALLSTMSREFAPMLEASMRAVFDPENEGLSAISYDDFRCDTCDGIYVSKALDFEHWDDICGDCHMHQSDGCECCPRCKTSPCECCEACEQAPGWCECCTSCGCPECECEYCEECDSAPCHCSSHSSNENHSFGSTKTAPWRDRADDVIEMALPNIDDCGKDVIDPIMSAADFYLLDAIKSGVRMREVTGMCEAFSSRFTNSTQTLMSTDGALAPVVIAAKRSHAELVSRLAPAFLAYGLSAVGGELRYHRACSGSELPTERGKAWKTFVKVVQQKGPSVLFDAVDLFEEFGGCSYGGEKWGTAAKVVGKYLEGSMPDWLFVDRVFTLQHNGGCFLNKVSWVKLNRRGWDLYSMKQVLDAHAADKTDYATLLSVASPAVQQLWTMSERAISRLARRHGGQLPTVESVRASSENIW